VTAYVSVIVVSHNSSALLVECVQSLLASSFPVRVLVSDNGSTDGSIESLVDLAAADDRLRVLLNESNLGFAAGNNRALALADGDYLLFINPDCLVRADTLARLVARLDETPSAGMAGCLIRNPDGSEERSCRRLLPTPSRLIQEWIGRSSVPAPLPDVPIFVEAISGAFMLVRRDSLARVGSFDEAFFMHWEDLDFCRRFQLAGEKILFVPEVEVTHFKGRSSRSRPLRVEWYKHVGLLKYLRKHDFPGLGALFLPVIGLLVSLRFLLRIALVRHRVPEPPHRAVGAYGDRPEIWVFGATSVIGRYLLPRLLVSGYRVRAFCTDPAAKRVAAAPHLSWHGHNIRSIATIPAGQPEALISLAPLQFLPAWIEPLAARGLNRLIGFSSTSRFTKSHSEEPSERRLVEDLADAEDAVAATCSSLHVHWVIFRPTMIYSLGQDRNITLLHRFIRRFGFFPMPGAGIGRRQPVHADDLAKACVAMLQSPQGWNRAYNLSGGQVLTYRQMVEAIFKRQNKLPRIIGLPEWLWRTALAVIRVVPAYRKLNIEMLRRVDADMCFDHGEASQRFGFAPRQFQP
jgi:GT2 family glycosyltransferase/nucleoside-diphosphate-sugar epimerase